MNLELPPVRFRWVISARWWDCVSDGMDMCGATGMFPGLLVDRWSYVELYETEEVFIAETQQKAERRFEREYPWIAVYHTACLGELKPPVLKKSKRRSAPVS